jgi:hypothetical protein
MGQSCTYLLKLSNIFTPKREILGEIEQQLLPISKDRKERKDKVADIQLERDNCTLFLSEPRLTL